VPDDPLTPDVDPSPLRSRSYFSVLARCSTGTSLQAAQADMSAVAASLERDFPNDNRNLGVLLTPLRADMSGMCARRCCCCSLPSVCCC